MKYLITKQELHSILEDGAYIGKDQRTQLIELIFPKYSDNECEIEDIETRVSNLNQAFKTISKRFDIIKDVVLKIEETHRRESAFQESPEID